jgi:hypothetical protein
VIQQARGSDPQRMIPENGNRFSDKIVHTERAFAASLDA